MEKKKKHWENPDLVGGQFFSGIYELEARFNCKIQILYECLVEEMCL